jgi:PAS domain S-box-containing protein
MPESANTKSSRHATEVLKKDRAEALAELAAANARLQGEIEARKQTECVLARFNEQLQQLAGVTQELAAARDLDEVFKRVRKAARQLIAADGVTIVLREGDQCHYADEDAIGPLWKGRRFPMSACISGWVMLHNEPAVIEDIYQDARIPVDAYRPTFVKSLAMFPLRNNEPLGAIGCYWARPHRATEPERQLMSLLADATARAIDGARAYEELARQLRERQRAEEALRHSEEQLRLMVESVRDYAIIQLDPDGRITSWNTGAERLNGYASAEVFGKHFSLLYPAEARAAGRPREMLARASAEGRAEDEGWRVRRNGSQFWASVVITPLQDENGALRGFVKITRDITERHAVELALRETNETMQAIFDAAPVAVLSFDLEGRVTSWSRGAERMFGWTAEEAMGRVCPTVPEEGLADFHAMIGRVARHGQESLVRGRQKKSGVRIQASVNPAPLLDVQGNAYGVMVILIDITERHRFEETIQAVSKQLLHAQEAESGRIARELHDQIGQTLTVAHFRLQEAQESIGQPAQEEILEQASVLIDQLHEQVRELAIGLRPAMLDDLGLAPAVRWELDRTARAAGLQCEFHSNVDSPALPFEIKTACFRVAQGALANVVRHASARRLHVALTLHPTELELIVEDDGTGFDPAQARSEAVAGRSMGLLTMEERVRFAGGTFAVESAPGKGTRLKAVFPLSANQPSS